MVGLLPTPCSPHILQIRVQSSAPSQVPRLEQRPPPERSTSHYKASFQSPTPSFEADDECSASDPSSMALDSEAPTHARAPQYPGEDTRLTSQKELFGWYSYGWAAEVFVICGVGTIDCSISTLVNLN